ncbi:MAG TPA: molybdate ABC transporter substrate-binding protein [Candidatus Sulfotelmatobacter sp.]|nr:molybdate ABC transporter substrate-binding protein [Candidatus Sulfotelmatobacter sp.]
MKRIFYSLLIGVLIGTSLSGIAAESKGEVTVAAAADLSGALKEVATAFEKNSGIKVKLSFGASGALTQQIRNGAPFDVFLSADMDYPRALIAENKADEASLYRYAIGKLVLWAPVDSPLDVEHGGMSVLADASVKKIAIANPDNAPYGRAAVAAMKHVDLYEKVKDRMVVGENVAQAAQFVESGNAQVGFVALTHAMSPAMKGKGKYWVIPAEAYPALNQGVVVISASRRKKEADAFLEYMKTQAAVEVLTKWGFTVPGK